MADTPLSQHAPLSRTAIVAMHYQNENCHPDGKIKVGIAAEATWREERLANARRLFDGARQAGVAIVHVRLAVPADYKGVVANTPLIREWLERSAWQEGTWGVDFIDGLTPQEGEAVVTHTRNSGFQDSVLQQVLFADDIRHVICCGVSTAYAVEGTVRQATDIGYTVTVAADACSTATAAQHDAALNAMRAISEIKTVDQILSNFHSK